MKKLFQLWHIALSLALLFSSASSAYAQNPSIITDLPGCDFQTGQLKASCIPVFIGHVIQTIFGLVSALFLINVMIAGYQIALGSIEGSQSGKDRLRWSIIGLIVSVCIFLIIDVFISVITP